MVVKHERKMRERGPWLTLRQHPDVLTPVLSGRMCRLLGHMHKGSISICQNIQLHVLITGELGGEAKGLGSDVGPLTVATSGVTIPWFVMVEPPARVSTPISLVASDLELVDHSGFTAAIFLRPCRRMKHPIATVMRAITTRIGAIIFARVRL
jgi:hypothetical protein